MRLEVYKLYSVHFQALSAYAGKLMGSNGSGEDIAQETFLSVDTVKYHIKKLYRLLDIHKRQALSDLLETYSLKLI